MTNRQAIALGLIATRVFAAPGGAASVAGVDAPTLDRLLSSIDQLNKFYTDVQPGDGYALTYVPGVETELALNGEPRGLIEGAEFSAVLFAIWIGRQPVDESLRKQLLTNL
jgi:hypothetical protein